MVVRRQGRARVGFWFFIVALLTAPAALQGYSCGGGFTGDATLSTLEVEVLGQNHISGFDPDLRTYSVWLPLNEDTAIVRAYSTDPASQVKYSLAEAGTSGYIDSGYLPLGGGEFTLAGLLPEGRSELNINVKAPGWRTAKYSIDIQVGCSDCDDGIECTTNACDTSVEVCFHPAEPDDTFCDYGGNGGTCVSGLCEAGFPCTEDGISEAIAVGGGPHTFACDGPTVVQTQAEIVIDNDVILDGEGNLTVQGSQEYPTGYHRVFSIEPGVTAQLWGMTITGGGLAALEAEDVYGGGIFNEGTLTLRSSAIIANGEVRYPYPGCCFWDSANVSGGGIYNTGVLTIESSDVSGNFTRGEGAGIYNAGTLVVRSSLISDNEGRWDTSWGGGGIYNTGSATVADSRIEYNEGGNWGGGIYNETGAEISVVRTTLFGNWADDYPGSGGIHNRGTLWLADSTVADSGFGGEIGCDGTATIINTTISGDGWPYGVLTGSGTLTLISSTVVVETSSPLEWTINFAGELHAKNSLFVGAVGGAYDTCASPIISEGYNIESPGDSCGLTDATDLVNVTAEELALGPLADNGGPTETHALLPGSVAIDWIQEAACLDAAGDPLTTDQRGVARPQGAMCDVGAFEAADCSGSVCDDGNDCTADHCDPADYAWCAHTTLPDGTSCDFGGVDGVCEAGACRERSWGTPVLIGPLATSGGIKPRVTMNPSGNVVIAVFEDQGVPSNIWSNRYTPTGGWGTAELIESQNAGDARFPEVAMDPNGNAVAVWLQHDGVRENIWSNRFTPAGGWGTAELLETDDGGASIPSVAIDANGNALVVWYQDDGTRDNIWSNRYTPAGGWGTPELVETNDAHNAWAPKVAMDANGNAVAAWIQWDGLRHNVWSNRYTPAVGWGAPELIETNDAGTASSPVLASAPDGNTVVVWEINNFLNLWSNRYTPGVGWETPELVQTGMPNLGGFQVAIDPNGNAVAVWHQQDGVGARIWSNRSTPAGGWGTPELIGSDDLWVARYPRVAMGANGNAVAVWWQQNLSNTNVVVWANHYTPSHGWGTAELLDDSVAYSPDVATDSAGNAVAVWTHPLGPDEGVWSNRFE